MKLIIYMKSGNLFAINVENWEFTGRQGVKQLKWTDATKGNTLVYVDMDEVEAIVEEKK